MSDLFALLRCVLRFVPAIVQIVRVQMPEAFAALAGGFQSHSACSGGKLQCAGLVGPQVVEAGCLPASGHIGVGVPVAVAIAHLENDPLCCDVSGFLCGLNEVRG